MPKVSILVPTYNQEKYIEQALDSLINQTLNDIEIICINDGSTDKTAGILDDYASKDSRVRVIHKENSGYGDSMNIGLANASGEYIGILEPDDFVDLNMFKELYEMANKNNLDVAKSAFYYYLGKENKTWHSCSIKKRNCNKVINIKDDLYILKIAPSIWSAIYKKEFLNKYDIRFLPTPGASYQDTSFAFKVLAMANRIMLTNKAYLYYRQDNENSSIHRKDKIFCICDEWDEITKYLSKYPEIEHTIRQVKLSSEFNSYKYNLFRIGDEFKDQFIEKYANTFRKYFENGLIEREFYKKVSKQEFQMLINDIQTYKNYIIENCEKNTQKIQRRKRFSIRINSSRISVVLFGKTLIEKTL